MRRLWLYYFPLLFIPNFGFSQLTSFGVLEVSDWLILPFILLLLLAPAAKSKQRFSQLIPLMWGFVFWALLSTLSIHFRYDYLDDVAILIGGCLKLARLALYVTASVLIARSLADPTTRAKWLWSLVAALFMLSVGLLTGGREPGAASADAIEGYKSYNVIIVSVAILCSYIVGLWIDNAGTRSWRRFAGFVAVFAGASVFVSSSLTSHGRGGWVAFAAGFAYILSKKAQTLKTLGIVIVLGLVSLTAYHALPAFQSLVDETFSPTADSSSQQTVDDGARISTWASEVPKLVNAPLLGTGFYHRGGDSGLWSTGSHNFFIQMFLETGVVGGILTTLIFAFAWRQAGVTTAVRSRVSIATRAALVTAIAGGMSGEYYYGGVGVLVLFAVLAIVGSLPVDEVVCVSNGIQLQSMRWQAAI